MTDDYSAVLSDAEATLAFGVRLARASFRDPDQATAATGSRMSPDQAQSTEKHHRTQQHDQLTGYPSLGGVIHLHGDLGAGKTTLARGMLRGYGFTGAVKSPTYTLVEPYDFARCTIYHFDLYRLKDAEEVRWLGVDDYFAEPNLCIVEWAEKGGERIAAADLSIHLHGTGASRRLQCQSRSAKGQLIVKRLCSTEQ